MGKATQETIKLLLSIRQELSLLRLQLKDNNRTIICMVCFLLFFSCTSSKTENKTKNEVLVFLEEKEYKHSVYKSDIPPIIMDSLSSINKEPFTIGDNTDTEKISFSDARILDHNGNDIYEYNKKLHFTLVNDSFCSLVYTEGGEGTHDVVDYFQYKGKYKHIRYSTTDILADTIKLRNFLEENPTQHP